MYPPNNNITNDIPLRNRGPGVPRICNITKEPGLVKQQHKILLATDRLPHYTLPIIGKTFRKYLDKYLDKNHIFYELWLKSENIVGRNPKLD